ncbi:MAG: PIG-L family deacetylase [Candidatus Kapaibacterium sp.]
MKKIFLLLFALVSLSAHAAENAPKVLIVTAHPDDETGFAASVYKITHDLKGKVDLALVTNGEAGFKYSTLAEDIYGAELTDEAVGRELLPTIRKREIMAGGKIIGIRNYYFFDQKDTHYTLDCDTVLTQVWNVKWVREKLKELILREKYDYIFCLLPTPETHGHHKAATILALQSLSELEPADRPIILGCTVSEKTDTAQVNYRGLYGFRLTAVLSGKPTFFFDRTQKFGFKDNLNYKVVVNWLIAEHKSQGVMQLGMNRGDTENFWYFDVNPPSAIPKVEKFFESLKVLNYKKKQY